MSVVFRAIDEPAPTRAEYWRHVLAHSLVPMDVRLDDGPTARDEILTGSMGAVGVAVPGVRPGTRQRARFTGRPMG